MRIIQNRKLKRRLTVGSINEKGLDRGEIPFLVNFPDEI